VTIDEVIRFLSQNGDSGQRLLESELRHTVVPARDAADLAQVARAHNLPPELEELWTRVESMRLYEDSVYGQWGLIILSPANAAAKTREMALCRPQESRPGDLVIGEFLGDSQTIVIRCEENAGDLGSVLVALPIDPRQDWPTVGDDLSGFLTNYLEAGGVNFWPH
jgi:hypothetical protein